MAHALSALRFALLLVLLSLFSLPLCNLAFGQLPTEVVVVGQVQQQGSTQPVRGVPTPPSPSSDFAVVDFSNPSNPGVFEKDPGFVGATIVDCTGEVIRRA
jgi:hypothetical protein